MASKLVSLQSNSPRHLSSVFGDYQGEICDFLLAINVVRLALEAEEDNCRAPAAGSADASGRYRSCRRVSLTKCRPGAKEIFSAARRTSFGSEPNRNDRGARHAYGVATMSWDQLSSRTPDRSQLKTAPAA